jgi:MFS family permease
MVLLGLGAVLVYPTLLAAVSDVAQPDWRASALGVYRLWRDGGYAVGALLAGVLADLRGIPSVWRCSRLAGLATSPLAGTREVFHGLRRSGRPTGPLPVPLGPAEERCNEGRQSKPGWIARVRALNLP